MWWTLICGILAALVALLNFYLSWLRYPIQKFLYPDREYHFVSGIPLIGTVLLIGAIVNAPSPIWLWFLIPLALIDTGGLPWFFISTCVIHPKRHRNAVDRSIKSERRATYPENERKGT